MFRISVSLPSRAAFAASLLAAALAPASARACACGCGVFDVATASMLPQGPGGTVFVQYAYQNQDHNWSGTGPAPAADNDDKDLRSTFVTTGLQYLFNRSWGVEVEVPYDQRYFRTTGGPSGDDLVSFDWNQLGDIRIQGLYTGFSPDLSTGVSFGVKLPTGSFTWNDPWGDVDRDSEIGTGSTDLLFGGFHRANLTAGGDWTWFAQGLVDLPVLTRDQYRPGGEVDAALGTYYNRWYVGTTKIAPVLQLIASYRSHDSGAASAQPVSTGYQRVMLSPGIEVELSRVTLYADVELPVYQHFIGDQLAAPALLKMSMSYGF
jgi:hypothetical protein